jgi:hypothetical protein
MFPLTGLKETWEGLGWRLAGAGGKMALGVGSIAASVPLWAAPEPLSKVGAIGALTVGVNTFLDGGSQVFRRAGGINALENAAGQWGQFMAGDEGEATARYYIGWSEFLFDFAAAAGTPKIGNVPLRQMQPATKEALQRAFVKMTEGTKALWADEFGGIAFGKIADAGVLTAAQRVTVWKLFPWLRGNLIEGHLAATEYSTWKHVGALNNGFYPLFDFQKGLAHVSLKTTNIKSLTWLTRAEKHIEQLESVAKVMPGETIILDLRIAPGGLKQAAQDIAKLVEYGKKRSILIKVTEF